MYEKNINYVSKNRFTGKKRYMYRHNFARKYSTLKKCMIPYGPMYDTVCMACFQFGVLLPVRFSYCTGHVWALCG